MPTADFFGRFGLFVVKGFLEWGLCARVRDEARAAAGVPGTVMESSATFVVDERVRRVRMAQVSAEARSLVGQRLQALKPELERHFRVSLTRCQAPQFLIYRQGDFYEAHADSSTDTDAHEIVRERRVSVVIFLNGEAEAPTAEGYCGGSLAFCGLLADPRSRVIGIPLQGETGLLVAFDSDLVHSVTPVMHGERHTIATWFA